MHDTHSLESELPAPAVYFPIRGGRYDVHPALSRLGTDFGNGAADGCLTQFDRRFPAFRANKIAARAERFAKYVADDDFAPDVQEAVARLLAARLVSEHPTLFTRSDEATLRCHLTGEILRFDSQMRLVAAEGSQATAPLYRDAFDALCCQIPEDIAIVRRTPDRGDWIAALHVCAPSAWAPEEKIGRTWDATHAPVPGMEKSRAAARGLVAAMIEREPTVRFTWSLQFGERLNDHPEPPPGISPAAWRPRVPAPDAEEPFTFRVERQVIWGMPEVDAALFAIRVHHTPFSTLRADTPRCTALRSALLSLSLESRAYKSLTEGLDAVLALLE